MAIDHSKKKANQLIHATSPYLLQHAYNPVNWCEWGTEALTRATKEDKPILVSIGYSACHWCHVMERESFESPEIAKVMNDHFICIKVDREERPDIDQVYMEAVQAMGGNGGWPLNVFLTPGQQPFYGGTYFGPQQWVRLLQQINEAFLKKRNDINASAVAISEHLNISDLQRFKKTAEQEAFRPEDLDKMAGILESRFDEKWGGLEKAPKFVMPTIWLFLLRYYAITNKPEALEWVTHTLTRMTQAGLYDQLGGGFCRYSVDREWFAPHFEKMLYDNAQLLSLYAETYAITKDPLFKTVVSQTVDWLEREMTDRGGGFYSALDADSESTEGKFYTWTYDELSATLGNKADSFAEYFGATREGNWEHGRNILNRGDKDFSVRPQEEIGKLMAVRDTRIRPALDDKFLTGWNAMTIIGLLSAYRSMGDKRYLDLARSNVHFIEENLIRDGKVHRSFKNKLSPTEGFLEDYAFLIKAYTDLYQSTFEEQFLTKAERWCKYTLDNFFDPEERYFHFAGKNAEPLIARKKEIFDNVIPASNSVMAANLYHLGLLLDREDWTKISFEMTSALKTMITSEPGYMSNWGILLSEMVHGLAEVAVVGPLAEQKRKNISSRFLPFALMLGTQNQSQLPLLKGRLTGDGRTLIHVCHDKTCQLPVESIEEAVKQLFKQ